MTQSFHGSFTGKLFSLYQKADITVKYLACPEPGTPMPQGSKLTKYLSQDDIIYQHYGETVISS